jgi:hypothetical protein
MRQRLRRLWCSLAHSGAMLPIHGRYLCPVCLLPHSVPFERPTGISGEAPRPGAAESACLLR